MNWISVKDKLPSNDISFEYFIAHTEDSDGSFIVVWRKNHFEIPCCNTGCCPDPEVEIDYYMPLPEKPSYPHVENN